jgi:hypothetical protein
MYTLYGLRPHLYADDTQIYGFCPPSASLNLQTRISACIDEVSAWMRSNRLQLNSAKTEILWSATSRRLHQLPRLPLRVGTDQVTPASVIRDLGIYVDADISMRSHVARNVSSCFAVLRQLRSIRRSVSRPVLQSLVMSRSLSAGLRQCDSGWHSIISTTVAPAGNERRCSAGVFFVEVRPHHPTPSPAPLAEGSRADYIQDRHPCVQVSTRVGAVVPRR